ncbi:MAG: Rne/Rng family ribonuclease [Candidatus Nanopelagicales bacterium]
MSDNDKPESNAKFSNDSSDSAKSSDEVTKEAPKKRSRRAASRPAGAPDAAGVPLFQAPPEAPAEPKPKKKAAKKPKKDQESSADSAESTNDSGSDSTDNDGGDQGSEGGARKRRRRGGRKRKKPGAGDESGSAEDSGQSDDSGSDDDQGENDSDQSNGANANGEGQGTSSSARRRRRRKRATGEGGGQGGSQSGSQSQNRKRNQSDKVTGVKGSTRLEAKKQRRREGREAGRRRTPVLTEAEFLARRESVTRKMIVRQVEQRVQIAVLEDDVLAEHYVSSTTNTSMVGNVYIGRVQNVLPSMEAAFIDIGRGRNAVLYAGEVNWSAAGLEGQPKRIELALKSGDAVMVQVTKDPVGQKGARLTGQISLPGRFLVYVPEGSMTGISRRLPDRERARLKKLLKAALPENSGVIVRTAAEGASEDQINADISRLTEQWESIQKKATSGKAPSVLYSEPDLATRVVRDIFNEDFESLTVSGDEVATTIKEYLETVSPELGQKVSKWTKNEDVFAANRVDEQLAKALDRKVWLPSGGSLVIDHTEAMTVVDVNTGRFTGQGGNLEETVTENNLEAAEEIARQLRLRDVGGIIVVDFIDMVLESNRDLVLRRLIECLGRDRTKHQVAEVTSLGLVQMTRKRIGQGLLETFSDDCEACSGRGVKVHMHPVDRAGSDDTPPPVRRQRPTGPIPGAPTNKGPNANASDDADETAPGADETDVVVDESSSPEDALDAIDLDDVDSSEVEEAAEVARDKASGKDLINVAVGVVVDEVDIDEDDDLDDDDDESEDDDDDSSDEDHILELESADDPA